MSRNVKGAQTTRNRRNVNKNIAPSQRKNFKNCTIVQYSSDEDEIQVRYFDDVKDYGSNVNTLNNNPLNDAEKENNIPKTSLATNNECILLECSTASKETTTKTIQPPPFFSIVNEELISTSENLLDEASTTFLVFADTMNIIRQTGKLNGDNSKNSSKIGLDEASTTLLMIADTEKIIRKTGELNGDNKKSVINKLKLCKRDNDRWSIDGRLKRDLDETKFD